jgi:outer membrane protein TolC
MTSLILKHQSLKLIRMHRFTFFLLLIAAAQLSFAQDGRRGNVPSSRPLNARDTGLATDFREKLVQLALQNPDYEIADRQVIIAGNDLKLAKVKFMSNLSGQVNYNEFTIKKQDLPTNFFPRYNVQLNVPFDVFFTRGKEISNARQNLGIAEAMKNQRFREVKVAVLSTYEDYLMHKQKLEFQNQVIQDFNSAYRVAENDFSTGTISQEEYNLAYKKWTDELSKKAELQRNFNITKIQLEMMIGMTLEEAIAK